MYLDYNHTKKKKQCFFSFCAVMASYKYNMLFFFFFLTKALYFQSILKLLSWFICHFLSYKAKSRLICMLEPDELS